MIKPNVLLIVTDQLRRDTLGSYGSQVCQTPNLDKLASEGTTFDYAFTPCGLCSPTRASLLTGLYPHSHQVLTNVHLHPVTRQLEPHEDILFSKMKGAGYRLGYVGKWHLHSQLEPPAFGFEHYVSLGDFARYRRDLGIPQPPEANYYLLPSSGVDPASPELSRPAFLADKTIELLDTFSQSEVPFFVRLDFHGPHPPTVIPEPYASMYNPVDIPPYKNFRDDLVDKPAVQRIKRRHWETENMSWEDWQPLVARYFGEITLIDEQVGRVLEHLDVAGLRNNTLVIFTSDHGDTMGAHGIWNKDYTMYDEIYRVPFIARYPGAPATGTRSDAYVHHALDLTPTLLELCGAEVPDGLHGKTLLPLFKGESQAREREAFCEFHGSHMGLYTLRMLQTDRYKYVFDTNDIDELYDHQEDPGELRNLAEDPSHAHILQEMRDRLVQQMKRTDDTLYNEWVVYWLTGDVARAVSAPGRTNSTW